MRVLQRIGRRGGRCSPPALKAFATCAPFVAVIDGDLQHDETLLPAMLARLKNDGLDLVVGSRNIEGGSMGRFAAWRIRLSNLGRSSRRVIACDLNDPMSGFFVADRRFVNEACWDLLRSASKSSGMGRFQPAAGPARRGALSVPHPPPRKKLDTTVAFEYLTFILDKLIGGIVPVQFVIFGLVGLSGVLVHLAVLSGDALRRRILYRLRHRHRGRHRGQLLP